MDGVLFIIAQFGSRRQTLCLNERKYIENNVENRVFVFNVV